MAASSPNGAHSASIATLETRVQGLDDAHKDLRRAILDLDSKIDQSVTALANRFDSSLSSLATKIDARATTQWPTIFAGAGVLTTIIIALGTALYIPIQRDTSRLDSTVNAVLDRGVFQREYALDQSRVNVAIDRLRSETVKADTEEQYRQRIAAELKNKEAEHERLSMVVRRLRDDTISRDAYNGRHEALIDDVKRAHARVDELRKDFGSSFTLSDKLKELQEQIKLLQSQHLRDYRLPKQVQP